MLIIFNLLLLLRVGRCTDDLIFETRTFGVGDDVSLTCTRRVSDYDATLFWTRLVSGGFPEFLGGTFAFDFDAVNNTPRITAKQEPGTFLLHISQTTLSDTGVYYCIKVDQLDMTFLKEVFLTTKAPEPYITANIQDPPSGPVHPGDSVTMQCSVLSDSERKTCSEKHRVYWLRAGSDKSHPSFIYAPGNSSDQCEKSPGARSAQKCVYSFSKTVSSSDAGIYYCAVATCGQILFGNGTKLDIQALHSWDLQTASIVLFMLCTILAISLIVNAFLVFTIKKKTYDSGNDAPATSGNQNRPQPDEASLIYSAPSFTREKDDKRRNAIRTEIVYTGVNTLETD